MIDKAPVKNTCPSINELLMYLEGFKRDFLNDDNEYDFEIVFSLIEDIRDANKELRDWGNELHRDVESLTDERHRLMDQLENVEKLIR
jgi:hypothetical protein